MDIHTYIHKYIHTYIYIYIYITSTKVQILTQKHYVASSPEDGAADLYKYMYVYMYVYMRMNAFILSKNVCMESYVCMYVCIIVLVYVLSHAHAHAHVDTFAMPLRACVCLEPRQMY